MNHPFGVKQIVHFSLNTRFTESNKKIYLTYISRTI